MLIKKITATSSARRSLQALAVAGTLAAGIVGTAHASSAQMSRYVLTNTAYVRDCAITAGAAYDGTRGWAIGAATAPCAYRHASTVVTVRLDYSADGGRSWHYIPSTVRSATFTNSFGMGSRELDGGGYCGGGRLLWRTVVSYSISGVGSGTVWNAAQPYQAGHC